MHNDHVCLNVYVGMCVIMYAASWVYTHVVHKANVCLSFQLVPFANSDSSQRRGIRRDSAENESKQRRCLRTKHPVSSASAVEGCD